MPVRIVPPTAHKMNDDPREVYKTTLEDAVRDFGRLFTNPDGSTLRSPGQSFLWSELRALVDLANYDFPGVAVHYGVSAGELRYAISVLDMTPVLDGQGKRTGYTFNVLGDPDYVLENNDFLSFAERPQWTGWAAEYQNVLVDENNNGNTAPVREVFGAKAVVFPWREELLEMFIGNCPSAICEGWRVVLSSITIDHSSQNSYRHGVAFHLEERRGFPKRWFPFLDDTNWAVLYQNKGANFGNLCPPSCDTYTSPV